MLDRGRFAVRGNGSGPAGKHPAGPWCTAFGRVKDSRMPRYLIEALRGAAVYRAVESPADRAASDGVDWIRLSLSQYLAYRQIATEYAEWQQRLIAAALDCKEARLRGKDESVGTSVNFCERPQCPAMGKSTAMGRMRYRISPMEAEQEIEMCPACVGDLVGFVNVADVGLRERSYNRPYSPEDNADPNAMTAEQLFTLAMKRSNEEIKAIE